MARERQFRRRHGLAVSVLVCTAATLALAVGTAPELPNPGKTAMSVDQQKQLGLKVAAQVYQQMPVLPDSSVETQYIRKLGKRLVATIPPEHSWPFEFHVIAQKEINAFALPGGEMFVNVGTIRAADNEAELAGVMAHEMSHVYMQHSAKQQEKASSVGLLAGIAGAIAGAVGGDLGTLAQTGIQFGAGTLMLKYSRGDEAQADAVGAIILWKAGYNPEALADFFEKIEKEGGQGPQFLSDHPNPGNRRAAIQKEIAEWPPMPKGAPSSSDFAAARTRATGAAAYSAQEISEGAKSGRWAAENRRNGATFAGGGDVTPSAGASNSSVSAAGMGNVAFTEVQPSVTLKETDLVVLKIVRPENWLVMQDQQTSVTIAPKAGVSGNAVAYGTVIQLVQMQDSNISVRDMTAAVVQGFEKADSNTKQHGQIQEITVNGMAAGSVEMETVSPMPDEAGKPQTERDWLVTIPRSGGNAVALVFVSTQRHFEHMKPTFEKMLRSVQF